MEPWPRTNGPIPGHGIGQMAAWPRWRVALSHPNSIKSGNVPTVCGNDYPAAPEQPRDGLQ
eukprot:scaffold275_cov167-Ochromonas_danica.AAC.7